MLLGVRDKPVRAFHRLPSWRHRTCVRGHESDMQPVQHDSFARRVWRFPVEIDEATKSLVQAPESQSSHSGIIPIGPHTKRAAQGGAYHRLALVAPVDSPAVDPLQNLTRIPTGGLPLVAISAVGDGALQCPPHRHWKDWKRTVSTQSDSD